MAINTKDTVGVFGDFERCARTIEYLRKLGFTHHIEHGEKHKQYDYVIACLTPILDTQDKIINQKHLVRDIYSYLKRSKTKTVYYRSIHTPSYINPHYFWRKGNKQFLVMSFPEFEAPGIPIVGYFREKEALCMQVHNHFFKNIKFIASEHFTLSLSCSMLHIYKAWKKVFYASMREVSGAYNDDYVNTLAMFLVMAEREGVATSWGATEIGYAEGQFFNYMNSLVRNMAAKQCASASLFQVIHSLNEVYRG